MSAPSGVINEDSQVQRDAAALLYQHGVGGLFVTAVAAVALVMMLPGAISQSGLLAWLGVMLLTIGARALNLVAGQKRRMRLDWNGSAEIRRFAFGSLATAVAWVAFPVLFFHELNQVERTTMAIILSAMAGGSATVLAASQRLAVTYCAALLLPSSVMFLLTPGRENAFLGALGIIFFLVLASASKVTHRSTLTALRLNRSNQRLMLAMELEHKNTERANAELTTAQSALRESLETLEDRIKARTVDLEREIRERERAEAQLRHAAYHDALTGLPNRRRFLARLDQALARMQRHPSQLPAVLFLDIDRFKVFNDSLGHAAGDQLLSAFANRLAGCLRPYDTLARLGGDEFTILLDDVKNVEDATFAAERILGALERPFRLAGRDVSITTSIGIALAEPGFDDPEAMLRDADTAMYRAKEQGRARYELFTHELHSRAMERLELEIELRLALERGDLHLAYQPIVALDSGRIAGFEALARWNNAGKSIPPDVFILLAEETGLIVQLGEWVLAEACRQARIWHDIRGEGPPVTVSVNVSAKQLVADVLGGQVNRVLAESGLRADRLHLEITESVLMDGSFAAEKALGQIRALGVTIDLDDFGTGYSSLGYLHRLPIDAVKIDRSFVSGDPGNGIANPKIVQAIAALAHSLGIGVTAEGVESAEQLTELRALRCTNAQGYYLSYPIDEERARSLVSYREHIRSL
jgi:diguanylate cyclase (GGDEF)-like protein